MSKSTKSVKRKKSSSTSLTCEYCSKICSTSQYLKTHRNIHTGQRPWKCNLCDFATNERKTLTCHVRRHTGETPYKCQFPGCGFQAKNSSAAKVHFVRIHSDLKPFECSFCPYKTKLNTVLTRHMKLRHSKKSSSSSSSSDFPCDSCERKYASLENLRKHQNEKHQNPNSDDKETEKEAQLISCNLCQAEFKNSRTLLYHVRAKHTMEKPFICALKFPSCDYSSVSNCGLINHQLCIHNVRKRLDGAENYKCNEDSCNYESKTKAGLKIHKSVHTSERNFLCPFENCAAAFKTNRGLKNHVKIVHETIEKPFKCAICPFSTKTNKQLTLHKKALHSTAEEKSSLMLSCPLPDCQHKTLQHSNLKTHLKSHTNEKLYECDICRNQFLHKSSLTTHKMMHDDVKNFKCGLCSYRGRRAGDLKDHIRGHTKEKPFSCHFPSCGASFRKKTYLNDHLATKHGKTAKEHKCTAEGCTVPPFATQSQLHNHIKLSHEPVKIYKCSQSDCDYESKWETNVKRHERTAHDDTEEILCKGCGIFKTTNKASLKNHQDKYCAMRKTFKCVQGKCKFVAESLEKLAKHKINEHGIRRQASINMNLLKKKKREQN